MSRIDTLEPKKYYGYIHLHFIILTVFLVMYVYASNSNFGLLFLPFFWSLFHYFRLKKYPILTIASDIIYYNERADGGSSERVALSKLKKIWIGKKEIPIRRFVFLNPELDAIFVLTEDERPLFLPTLNSFKPKDREEIKALIKNIQETVDQNQTENL
jgi:hypothetical protein